MVATGPEVAFAFGLSFAAGLSTCIGGIILFFKCMINLTKPTSLGISLAVSAGVMIFISLTEIFNMSVKYFKKEFSVVKVVEGIALNSLDSINDHSTTASINNDMNTARKALEKECDSICKGHAWSAASASFLLGVLIIFLLDFIVHKLSPDNNEDFDPKDLEMLCNKDVEASQTGNFAGAVKDTIIKHSEPRTCNGDCSTTYINGQGTDNPSRKDMAVKEESKTSKKQLNRMGVLTALAVGIHNLPEGIATYIAARNGSRLGAAMAIGIALHNIPEGVAIATPVYFATESKCKALGWTILAGLAEPIGSILCWLVVGEGLSPAIEGVIYGVVAGMMITVSFKDLIPTSLKYNTDVNLFISSMLSGMAIMIISLILFAYAGL